MIISSCHRLVTRRFLCQIVFAYLVCPILPMYLCNVNLIYPAITLMLMKLFFFFFFFVAISESLFRRFRILAKTTCHACHVCRSSSPHVSTRLSLEGFTRNLILRTSMKACRENPNLVETGQKHWALYM